MKSAFQAVFVIIMAGLLTFAASKAWQQMQKQDQKIETLIHSVETLRILSETPPTPKRSSEEEQAISTPVFPLFQAIDQNPTIDEVTSPDGEWIADVRALGRTPFSRGTSFWLELINQKGKPNRMIYLDWFERPQDARIQPHPIGWSKDGQSIYLGYGNLPGASLHEPGNYAFMNAGEVFQVNLNGQEGYANNRVNPYNGAYPANSSGYLLDIIPRQDIGLWLEELHENEEGKGDKSTKIANPEARLILFSLEDTFSPKGTSSSRVLLTLPTDKPSRVTSATMSSEARDIFYVTHEDKKNDELFYLDTSTNTAQVPIRIDLGRFAPQLHKQGITTPYQIEIQKTALTNKNDLFLIFTGANGKRITNRWVSFNGQTNLGQD